MSGMALGDGDPAGRPATRSPTEAEAAPPRGRLRALAGWLPRAWAEIDREREPGRRFGWREGGALLVAAVGLAVMHFGGAEITFLDWVAPRLADGLASPRLHPHYELAGLLHWAAFCVLGYLVVPAVWLRATGERLGDYYLGWGGTRRHLGVYLALFVPVLVAALVASKTASFQAIYPMYALAGRSWFDLLAWELAYGLQFFALEFFFRGFMLRSLLPVMGYGAVFVMVVPYCMLHFGKTFAESIGSIIAGVVLGTMAMRWRSIWGGALLHWLVGVTMDVASMVQKGEFPPGRF